MVHKRGVKKREQDKKFVPIIFRVRGAEGELLKKRASMLGMSVSAFLRLLINRGKVDLEETEKESEERG